MHHCRFIRFPILLGSEFDQLPGMYDNLQLCVYGMRDVRGQLSETEKHLCGGVHKLHKAGIAVSDGEHCYLPDKRCICEHASYAVFLYWRLWQHICAGQSVFKLYQGVLLEQHVRKICVRIEREVGN